eukprot:8994621-Alexandrium_andersonii.AAC.1
MWPAQRRVVVAVEDGQGSSSATRERLRSLPKAPPFAGGAAAAGRLTLSEALGAARPAPKAKLLSYRT